MSVIVGVSGATRNAAVALCDAGRAVAVCERERLTRTRRASLRAGQLPLETLEAALRVEGHAQCDISAYAIAEPGIELPPDLPVERLDHHYAHAAASFYTSPFDEAVVLVCDRHGTPDLTIWRGDQAGIRREDFPWIGPGFATVYSLLPEGFGFAPEGDEHRVESLAHIGRRASLLKLPPIDYRHERVEVSSSLGGAVANLLAANGHEGPVPHAACVAAGLQCRLGELLLELLTQVKRTFGGRNLCLAGGLFFNSYFNTLVAQSGIYEQTFVPVNPGNAGVALGAALAVAQTVPQRRRAPLSPFLGPGYESDEVKAILDNCKLSYDYHRNGQLIDRTAAALAQGKLVGWFQGRMEWGPRALGNRSILASPVSPYVLENLNVFLKKREPHRSYSVSICAGDVTRYFRGPATSHFMEYEYDVIEPDILRSLLPLGATRLRVQTVPESAGMFHALIKAFGDVSGIPILVNTSFNGFNEPIVCTPRDAVRVFYGTGLDMAAIDGFVLQK